MSKLLAYQPMDAEIDASTTMEVKVPLTNLGLKPGDTFSSAFGHVRRGVAKVHPSFDYALSGDVCAAPAMDGHMAEGEWDKARVFNLVLESDSSPTDVKAYMMHDAHYLYVAVTGEIPHNGFIAFGIYKEGAYSPNMKNIIVLTDTNVRFWETAIGTPGAYETAVRVDGTDLYESALGFSGMATRKVFVQLIGANGKALTQRGSVLVYLSDDANGDSKVATEPDGAVAIVTDGVLIPILTGVAGTELAKTIFQMVSEADGDIDISIVNATTDTFYLVLVLPSGKLVVSDAIEFST